MTKEEKKKLLDMLQDISYAYEDGGFWKAWASMQKYISELNTIENNKKENN